MAFDPIPMAAAGVVAAISGGIGWLTTRQKSGADVAGELVESSIAMVRELRQDVASLRASVDLAEAEVHECERRNKRMQADIDRLTAIVSALSRQLASLTDPDDMQPGL